MHKPKITILIPTRERPETLVKTLQTVTAQDYDNLEIIIVDNFSGDSTEDVVRGTNDPRVKYINPGKRLSMSLNWEFGLSHVTEGWVNIIGDDDGIVPNALNKVAELIDETKVKAIRSANCKYRWPSVTGKTYGKLMVPMGSSYSVRDAESWLRKTMLGQASAAELPALYAGGFIHLSVLEKAKIITGTFYQSCIPDIYSAIAISSIIDSYVYSNDPLGISGMSGRSNGASNLGRSSTSSDEPSELEKFQTEDNIPLHKDIPLEKDGEIPLSMSLQALIYESYLQSAPLRKTTLKEINHQQQLELILKMTRVHSPSAEEWFKRYARIHNLDYEAIQRKAKRRILSLQSESNLNRLQRLINISNVGSPSLPIKDVYEASIAAAAIRESVPGRLTNIMNTSKRFTKKVFT